MPVINCTPELQGHVINGTWSSFDRVSYIGVMAAADIGECTAIHCETRFVQTGWNTIDWGLHVENVADTPPYRHAWNTSIRAVNTTGITGIGIYSLTVQM